MRSRTSFLLASMMEKFVQCVQVMYTNAHGNKSTNKKQIIPSVFRRSSARNSGGHFLSVYSHILYLFAQTWEKKHELDSKDRTGV